MEEIGEEGQIMAKYIEGPPGPRENSIDQQRRPLLRSERPVSTFPILTALLHEFQAMSTSATSSSKTGRPRGRRAAAKVPCDDCIARASANKDEGAAIELCEKCTTTLHRPRRKQQEQPNVKRVRRQSNAIIDTAL